MIETEHISLVDLLNRLADSAVKHTGNGPVSETDAQPSLEHLYTETHLALLLFLLNHAAVRRDGLEEAAVRLQVWDALGVNPVCFNSMAITLLGLVMRRAGLFTGELASAVSALQARRRDYADKAWHRLCGNNMYLQQLVTDLLLAPLSEGRSLGEDAGGRLDLAFASCMSSEGYFFDLPRPGAAEQRQFPLTYNLKILFLLAICCHYLPDSRLEQRLRTGLEATIPLFTDRADCSYFGRTDQTTFAAGLAVFCLRAAAARYPDRPSIGALVTRAEERFHEFPLGADGCLEVNGYPLPSSQMDRILSRDDYAYRWQYAVAGAAYALLGRYLFPLPAIAGRANKVDESDGSFSSVDLGIVRAHAGGVDLFIRTTGNPEADDRRHAGPSILRLECSGRNVVGTIPVTMSSDSRVMVPWERRSVIARHCDLLRYRWLHGFEALQWELAGFVPVLRSGHRAWIPAQETGCVLDGNRLSTVHRYRIVHALGWRPAWNHFAYLAARHTPTAIRSLFRRRPLLGNDAAIQLYRSIVWTGDSVSIDDRITGDIKGKELIFATRLLTETQVEVHGLTAAEQMQGWSSDGPQIIQMYRKLCPCDEASHRIVLTVSASGPLQRGFRNTAAQNQRGASILDTTAHEFDSPGSPQKANCQFDNRINMNPLKTPMRQASKLKHVARLLLEKASAYIRFIAKHL